MLILTSGSHRVDTALTAQRIGVEGVDVVGPGDGGVVRHADGADRERVAHEAHAELAEERLRDGAERDARRRLAGAGALEHGPCLVVAVLLHADEVGVPMTSAE